MDPQHKNRDLIPSSKRKLITIEPIDGDATTRVLEAINEAKNDTVIQFTGECYHFWPERAYEAYYFISNNRHGLKRIAFPLVGRRNVVIDGGGARFIFHGEIVPFVVDQSKGVTLRNFSVDWERPFYSQGEVVEAGPSGVDVSVDDGLYPYRIEMGQLIFEGEGWESPLTTGVFAFDPKTRAPAYLSGDSMGLGFPKTIRAEATGKGIVRLCEKFPRLPELGTVVVFRHHNRHNPAVFLVASQDISLEAVTLYQAGGMGVIGQFCENVELLACEVTPAEGRIFSVCADASHFVNCRGLIRVQDCLFENQLDDPLNVHGLNTRITEIVDEHTLLVELVHHEQHGVSVGFAGDSMRFSDNATLLGYATNEIAEVNTMNARFVRVRFVDPLPEAVQLHHVIENLSWMPDLFVTGCTIRNNRARGFLVSTQGRVQICRNQISASGAGIKISGDANYWFESGAVEDVEISDNDFGECCYGDHPWGKTVIDIDPEIPDPESNPACFHRNIRIVNNRFATSDIGILFARSVDGLTFKGNQIRQTDLYPPVGRVAKALIFEGCQSVLVEDNEGLAAEETNRVTQTEPTPT
jgi:hypothetical protein